MKSSFTLQGSLLLVLAVVAALWGFLFSAPAMLSLGLLVVVLFMTAWVVSWWNLRRVELHILTPARVHAGRKFDLQLQIVNRRRVVDSAGLRVSVQVMRDLQVEASAAWLAAQSMAELKIPLVAKHRGCVMELEYVLSSEFPFGLFSHSRKEIQQLSPPLLVMPKMIVPGELMTEAALQASVLENGVARWGEWGGLRGVRPWRPGDPAKHIHWPASARSLERGQGLRVREYEPPSMYPRSCRIVFHSYGEKGTVLREDRFERALAFMVGAVKYLSGMGVQCVVCADFLAWSERDCSGRAGMADLLAILAQVRRSEQTEAHELQRALGHSGEPIVVISEVENVEWVEAVAVPPQALLVDIVQVQFQRRKTRSASEGRAYA